MFASFEFLLCIFYLHCYIILVLNLRLAWVFDKKKKKKNQELCDLVVFYSSFNGKNMTLKPFPLLKVKRGEIKKS